MRQLVKNNKNIISVVFKLRRRYFPLELLYNILDGMSSVKLNVFHFHFVDFCRFSVESKLWVCSFVNVVLKGIAKVSLGAYDPLPLCETIFIVNNIEQSSIGHVLNQQETGYEHSFSWCEYSISIELKMGHVIWKNIKK